MKLLIHSNGPTAPTGYGVQTALLAERLHAAGHEVAIIDYLAKFQVTNWKGIRVYPGGYDAVGNDIIHMHAQHWFDGDPAAGWIITLTDVWGITNPQLANWQVAAWTPVDHYPLTPEQRAFFVRTGARPLAMSEWGANLIREAGFDPLYVPLSIDTAAYKPTDRIEGQPTRQILEIEPDSFVVMMNAMNKGSQVYDRKGFGPALQAFGRFAEEHQDAVLYLHTHMGTTMGGAFDLWELAAHSGISPHQLKMVDQYAYYIGLPAEYMAACYTAADLLLAPSAGEGFCVPLIEAQACGTPVIASDFSAQPELVGAGWTVPGELVWDQSQHSRVFQPSQAAIVGCLEAAYEMWANDRDEWSKMCQTGQTFAQQYDADRVFDTHWVPALAELDGSATRLELDRTDPFEVTVVVPTLNRPQNVKPLVESFRKHNNGSAQLVFVVQKGDTAQKEAVLVEWGDGVWMMEPPADCTTFAQKVNYAVTESKAKTPWVFICGDDCEFTEGWLEAAAKYADTYDVIGTSDGGINARVASGQHADHFFVRRSYVDTYGASLDGPGVLAHEGYRHYFVDWEIIELAKHRKVFTPCLESVVKHHRLGREDDTYRLGAESFDADQKKWPRRQALIAQS